MYSLNVTAFFINFLGVAMVCVDQVECCVQVAMDVEIIVMRYYAKFVVSESYFILKYTNGLCFKTLILLYYIKLVSE